MAMAVVPLATFRAGGGSSRAGGAGNAGITAGGDGGGAGVAELPDG